VKAVRISTPTGARQIRGVFGTKMRSVINRADAKGIESVVDQHYDPKQILAAGLMRDRAQVSIKA
jgi:fructose-bisphosphate aldolase class I